ncbi:MAG: hypothetical protein JRH19_02380, partial [Deltaproteobacteria bacterium]|nr:hypothetical protein [Deltaproteobacteria bacterium]
FTADSAQRAADVAQHLANDFIQEHIAARVKTTQTSLEFIAGERERLASAIAEVESNIARVKDENEESLPEHLTTNQRTLERIESDLRYAYRQLDVSRSDESFWQHQVSAAAEMSTEEGSPQKRLKMLELLLAEQSAKGFTDRHPDMIKVRQEMQELSLKIEATEDSEGEERPLNFAQQNAESERKRGELRVKGAEEDIARLVELREEVQERIAGTPRVAEQLDGLMRRHLHLMESVRSFENLHVEATVQANMERRQLGERFRILEPAIPPLEPSSPNRVLIIVMGMMLGGAVGGAIGIVLEGTDSSFHQPRDLQGALGIPVLAAIPSIELESDMVRRRRRLRLQVLAAVLVAGIGIVGGGVTYMYVNGAPGFVAALLQGDEGEAAAPAEGASLDRERSHRG